MTIAIVTDGLWRKSLSAVRSLGKAGYTVAVTGTSWVTTAFWSRYAKRRLRCPDVTADADGFGETLLAFCAKQTERPVLLPMEDATLEWLSANREAAAAHADFLIPDEDALRATRCKDETLRIAAQLGLPVPETVEPANAAALAETVRGVLERGESARWIVKPVTGSGSAGLVFLDRQELPDWEQHWQAHGRLIVQRRVPARGRGLGVSALMDRDGRCVATFAHARLQEYPNTGGPSTSRISIRDERLTELSVRLLTHLRWRGVAMVEWKDDPDTGHPVLMEVNPRFWGSLELAVRAGVDFPVLYAEAARGLQPTAVHDYEVDVVCRWMLPGEILRYVTQERGAREGLRKFLRGLPRAAEEWDKKDLRGALSALVCPALCALNPRYWKYLRR